jgi:hypothetical protein
MPPPYAWSTADYAIEVTGPMTVTARFATP